MPSFASPFSLDALLARCPQLQWKPDEKTMLFFNGDEARGAPRNSARCVPGFITTREKMALKKILVTSALPKEGKSFTAANLAQVMVRQHGRRVLLIDADLRGPRLHMMLGTTSSPGLSDYLQGGNDEFSIMQRGPMENLFFIPSGQQISDPCRTGGQRAAEDSCCSGWRRCSTGSSSIRRLRCRSPMPVCWRRPATVC